MTLQILMAISNLTGLTCPRPPQPVESSVAEKPAALEPEKRPELKVKGKKKLAAIMAASAILLLIILFFLVLKPSYLSSSPEAEKKTGPYRAMDPILTNLEGNRYIRIALLVRTAPEKKETCEVLETRVRDAVLTFLGSTEIKMTNRSNDLRKTETFIQDELTAFLDREFANQPFFKG